MNINTVIYGELHGETWGGGIGSMPFIVRRNRKLSLKGQLEAAITGDFIKDTVTISGAAHVTVSCRKGHEYTKRVDLADLPSLR